MWTLLSDTVPSNKKHVLCRCKCGVEKYVRVADLLYGGSKQCVNCAAKSAQLKIPEEERVRRATHASHAALRTLQTRPKPAHIQVWGDEYTAVRKIMTGAKTRCTSDRQGGTYDNYKARGIEFRFPSAKDATIWVLENLGPRPADRSIDRIDNEGHYEPGNLRWATIEEQMRNRRQFKATAYGERVRRLRSARPDLHQQTIRDWIKHGYSDEEIMSRGKYEYHSTSV